jgi:hypothetical protein
MTGIIARSLVLLLVLAACAGPKETSGFRPVGSDLLTDGEAQVAMDFGFEPKPGREMDFVVQMKGLGTEEVDKIVVDVGVDGFILVEGVAEWNGFVAPREKHSHRVALRAQEEAEIREVTVTVRRSLDSKMLLQKTFSFAVVNERIVAN